MRVRPVQSDWQVSSARVVSVAYLSTKSKKKQFAAKDIKLIRFITRKNN
jgi:hypothetical protein